VRAQGVEVWSDIEFVLRHLESVLRQNLATLVGLEETTELIREWERSARALPDAEWRLRLSRLLKRLLDDQVPIVSAEEILEVVAQYGMDNLAVTTRAVRLRLRHQLPGNQASIEPCEAPEDWEPLLSGVEAEGSAGLPAAAALALQSKLRAWARTHHPRCALVLRDSQRRELIRALTRSELPDLWLLAREEVLPRALLQANEKASVERGERVIV
jgi:flagellar biosynthesis component FlhA